MSPNNASEPESFTEAAQTRKIGVRVIFDSFLDDLRALSLPFKILVGLITAVGVGAALSVMWIGVNAKQTNQGNEIRELARRAKNDQTQGRPSPYYDSNLPTSNRNQGLEEVLARFDALTQRFDRMEREGTLLKPSVPDASLPGQPQPQPQPTQTYQRADLNQPLSPTYNIPNRNGAPSASGGANPSALPVEDAASQQQPVKTPVSSPPQPETPVEKKRIKTMTVARYSAVESVILVGFFARSAATPGAAGAMGGSSGFSASSLSGAFNSSSTGQANAALGVGARFVALIKGEIMMPNGFKSSVLDSCFIGGSAIGSLSDSRAKAIAEAISCIGPDGQITDIPVQGYVQDADGTNGIAGNLVNKQGPIVMRSALAGLASGLGQAISPYQVAGLSTSAGGVQFPSTEMVARTAAGAGISNASSQIASFYLSYAREALPGVEVTAGSRVTWIFTQPFDVELAQSTGAKK